MAKTPKPKTAHKPSLHSRANRRAPSPSPLHKKPAVPTTTTARNPPTFLSANPRNGITKSQKPKPLKRSQRLRIERGREKAANVVEQRGIKVAGSEEKGRGKRGRRVGWEELNEGMLRALGEVRWGGKGGMGAKRRMKMKKRKGEGKEGKLQLEEEEEEEEEGEDGWIDEDEAEVAMDDEDEEEEGEEVRAPMPGDDDIEGEESTVTESRRLDAHGGEDLEEEIS